MSYALFGIIGILIAWKWGNWKNWKEYYPTILYLIVADKIYDVLTQSKPFWYYGYLLGHYPFFDVTVAVLLYPATIILFLTFFPEAASKMIQGVYFLLWVLIYTLIEYLASITGGFTYCNGWNLSYSVVFNMIMFPLLYLHYKKPLLVWPISSVLAFLFMFLFEIPLSK